MRESQRKQDHELESVSGAARLSPYLRGNLTVALREERKPWRAGFRFRCRRWAAPQPRQVTSAGWVDFYVR
jgi:hypothetical protein